MGLRNNRNEAGGLWDRKTDERDCGFVCFGWVSFVVSSELVFRTKFPQCNETGYRAVDDAIALSLIT